MRWPFLYVAVALLACSEAPAQPPAAPKPMPLVVTVPKGRKEPVSYAREVADVLGAKCVGCHSAALAENRLNLEEVPLMLKGGKRGPALVPGRGDASLLFQMAAHQVEPVMPPAGKKGSQPLTADELGLLKLWIDQGAKDDSAEAEEARPVVLGTLPPGVHPVNALDLTADGARVACGRANVVQVFDVDSGLKIRSLGGHKDLIQSVRFSPDGRLLAAGSYQIVTLWSVPTGGHKATFAGHTDPVQDVEIFGESGLVVSAGFDRTVRVWDADGKPAGQITLPAPVLSLGSDPAGRYVAVGGADHVVRLLKYDRGQSRLMEVRRLEGHAGPVNDVVVLRRDDAPPVVVSASSDGTVRLWPVSDAKEEAPRVLKGPGTPLRAVAAAPDHTILYAAGDDGKVRVWDLATGEVASTIDAHEKAVLALDVDPETGHLLTGSADRTGKRIDPDSGATLAVYRGHVGAVNSVAFGGPDRVITGGADGAVKVWEAGTGQGVIAFGHSVATGGNAQPVTKVVAAGDGRVLSASADKTVKLWGYEGRWAELRTLGPHAFRVLALDFNPDGTLLAAGGGEPSRSGEVRVWEVGKGLPVRTLDAAHSDTVFALRFSPDGTRLASAGADKFVKITGTADGKELRALEGHTHHVMAVDWKSDGKQLVSGGADNQLKVWDAETGEPVKTLSPAGKQVTAVRWLAGRAEIAGASGDRTVRLWSADGGVRQTYSGANDFVFCLAASADGARVAEGAADGTVLVWNGKTGAVLRKLDVPAGGKPSPKP